MCATRHDPAGPSRPTVRGRRRKRIESAAVAGVLSAALLLSPPAVADPDADIRAAITLARSETPCGPLRYHPIAQRAAEVFNRMTDDYLDHTATRVQNKDTTPGSIPDPLPGLRDLGYPGTKAYLLQGAHKEDSLAIKGALLQGYASGTVADCSFADFGVNMRRNERTGYYLVSVVLAVS